MKRVALIVVVLFVAGCGGKSHAHKRGGVEVEQIAILNKEQQFTRPQSIRAGAFDANAFSVVNTSKEGGSAALSAVSENPITSSVEVTGRENSKGTIKVSHINRSGSDTGDQNAAALSIDIQCEKTSGPCSHKTAAQGIFITSTLQENTGAWLTVHETESESKGENRQLYRLLKGGIQEVVEQTVAPGTPEAGKVFVYFKGLKLVYKTSDGVVHEGATL